METVKALSPQDTHFFVEFPEHTLDIDAIKIILVWNEGPANVPLSQKYDYLKDALSSLLGVDLDLSNTYLLLEKACAIVASLKKTLFGLPNSNSLESGLTGVPMAS